MPNRQWNEGIHQSIEAKENVPLSDMNQTIASITYQNLFLRRLKKYNELSNLI